MEDIFIVMAVIEIVLSRLSVAEISLHIGGVFMQTLLLVGRIVGDDLLWGGRRLKAKMLRVKSIKQTFLSAVTVICHWYGWRHSWAFVV